MPDQSLRHSQLIDYEHAAAGHDGIRSDKMGALLVKPCKQAEIDFYETTVYHPDFQYYLPTFYGTLAPPSTSAQAAVANHSQLQSHSQALQVPDGSIAIPLVAGPTVHSRTSSQQLHGSDAKVIVPSADTWVPSGGRAIAAENNIVLENVADGFDKPNILDVKLGRRLWADDAPPAKRQKLDQVAEETTSGPLGFRIAGMKTWVGKDTSVECDDISGYRKYDKAYGRGFTVDTVRRGFEEYFFMTSAGVTADLARKVIQRFIEDLRGLQKVLEREESRMYSASLLFVYEGEGESLKQRFEAEKETAHIKPSIPASQRLFDNNKESDASTSVHTNEELESASSESEVELPKVQALKVIDFAHAKWTPGLGADENTICGIRSVIKILERLLS